MFEISSNFQLACVSALKQIGYDWKNIYVGLKKVKDPGFKKINQMQDGKTNKHCGKEIKRFNDLDLNIFW